MARSRKNRMGAKRTSRKNRPSLSKVVAKEVRQIAVVAAREQIETKFVQSVGTNVGFNSIIGGGECYSLIPPLLGGVGTYQRLDNSIRPTSIQTDWHISIPAVARSVSVRVDLYLLRVKKFRNFADVAAAYPSGSGVAPTFLFSGGAGETINHLGIINYSDYPVNTRDFSLIKHHSFTLAANVGLAQGDTTSGNAPNVPGETTKHIRYKHKVRAKYNYLPGGTNAYPNEEAPFWVMGYSRTDGGNPDVANQSVICSWTTKMFFKDA